MVGQHTKQQDKDSRVSDVKINVNITSYINQPMSELTRYTYSFAPIIVLAISHIGQKYQC